VNATAPSPALDRFRADFERLRQTLPGAASLRRKAMDRLLERGFPAGAEETWRFTDPSPILDTPLRPASGTANPGQFAALARGPLKDAQLAFVDGRSAPAFSSLALPAGVEARPVSELLKENPAALDGRLLVPDQPFAALNLAFFGDGAWVRLAPGTVLDRPLHLLFLSTLHGDPYVSHPRVFIELGAGARATVVKSFLGPAGGTYLTNAVTTIRVGEGAALDLTKVQRESRSAFHVEALEAVLERSAHFTHHSISLGGRLARNDFDVVLDGEGAEASLYGLYEVAGAQHVDHHTTIDHAKPHTASLELYKGILDGTSRAVFDGRVLVRPHAQKTRASQTNRNLLISPDALVHTKPQLEILANDVKCRHGATIGQLDEAVLFYLRSRGIGLAEARRLLIHAFASEIVDTVKTDAVRAQVGGCLGLMTGTW
jgi:Fe-S cluster assembly protein SufD